MADDAWRRHYLKAPRSTVFITNTWPPETITITRSMALAASDNGVNVIALCLSDVEDGEWTRMGFEKRWTFTGRIGGEDKQGVCLSTEAMRSLESVVAWRERSIDMEDGISRTQAIRAAIEASAPGTTRDTPGGFVFHDMQRRMTFKVSAQLTDAARQQRDDDERAGRVPTRIVPVDETPAETAGRILGRPLTGSR